MERQMFKVEMDGVEGEAELLTVITLPDYDKEYAIYSVPGPNDTANLFASILVHENGEDTLVDIEDAEEKAKVAAMIDEIIGE